MKMKMKTSKVIIAWLIITIIMGLNSCVMNLLCVDGNGIIESEDRSSPEFSKILNTTAAEVILTTGEQTGVVIETDINLLQYFRTSVSNNTLEIETRGANCIRPSSKSVIYITAENINGISLTGSGDLSANELLGSDIELKSSGSGNMFIEYVEGDDIDIKISGSGDVIVYDSWSDAVEARLTGSGNLTISGESVDGNFTSSGSGECYAGELSLSTSNILISGSGDVYTSVSNELIATISGSGNIFYKGNPVIYSNITGSGRLIQVN
jgi:hypothetical protein